MIVAELQAMAEEALGNRSTKVKEILARADRSHPGIEAAINDVSHVSLLFVDASRLQALAFAMRSRVAARIGLPPPAVSQSTSMTDLPDAIGSHHAETHAEASPTYSSDWKLIVAELETMAEEALGNRSSTVKKILEGADRSPSGIEAAITDVSQVTLLFVDTSRLQALASAMRSRVAQRTGSPPPAVSSNASISPARDGGCLGNASVLLLLTCLIATAALIASALNITS